MATPCKKIRSARSVSPTPGKRARSVSPSSKRTRSVSPCKRTHLRSASPPAIKRVRREQISQMVSKHLERPGQPVGRPWPLGDLCAFELPHNIGWGQLLIDVMKERGWRVSTSPCHTMKPDDDSNVTVFVKEFEAHVLGQTQEEAFGKKGMSQEGHRLQVAPLRKHELWMMSRCPYRVPDTACGRTIHREDFPRAVALHGTRLPGEPGNYRTCKFPGTETALFKTNMSLTFRDKNWYPVAYVLPKEKDALLHDIQERASQNNYWIAKPKNDYGGAGIRVYRGTDPELMKLISESEGKGRSLVQHYLADPLLIGGYKFHMRIHLAVTSLDPPQAFIQENGQCLFATEPYTLSSKTLGAFFKPPVHVTNLTLNATEANKDNFLKEKPVIGKGQQLRMRELEQYLADHDPSFNKRDLWVQIRRIAADTVRHIAQSPSVRQYGKLVPDRHFEIFGMDLMLDKNLKVYMCETNTDPGLDYPSKEILGSPNPDFGKESSACNETWHDLFALLGLDAGRPQSRGSLKSWYEVDFSE